jgi:hypothetical protein
MPEAHIQVTKRKCHKRHIQVKKKRKIIKHGRVSNEDIHIIYYRKYFKTGRNHRDCPSFFSAERSPRESPGEFVAKPSEVAKAIDSVAMEPPSAMVNAVLGVSAE